MICTTTYVQEPFVSGGFSEDAVSVGCAFAEIQNDKMKTASYCSTANNLEDIFKECSSDDWDGYGAKAINAYTYRNAWRFINTLPSYLPLPELGCEPDGQITFEWFKDSSNIISISVSQDSYLHFASISGYRKRFGTEYFLGEIPCDILDIIHKVIEE